MIRVIPPLQSTTNLTMSRLSAAVAFLYFAHGVFGHEHHGEDIPEGEAISAEPIVRSLRQEKPPPEI